MQIIAPATTDEAERVPRRTGRDPLELFADYLHELGVEDDRITALFRELLEDELGSTR